MEKNLLAFRLIFYIFSLYSFFYGCGKNAQSPLTIKGLASIIGKWKIVATFLAFHFIGDFVWHPATSSYTIQYDSLGNFISSDALGLNVTCFQASFKKRDSIVLTQYNCSAYDSTIIEKLTIDSLIL